MRYKPSPDSVCAKLAGLRRYSAANRLCLACSISPITR
jgi:hypothetical protein